MTIIIPYKSEVHNGLELRYALRSIEKHLQGYDEVILIGDCPEWCKCNCIFKIDIPGRKEFNIYRKLLFACELSEVTENFLMWNDDHFLLKPLHVNDIKYWHNGSLENQLGGSARNRTSIQNTITMLRNIYGEKKELLNFDIHVPIIYNKHHFKERFGSLQTELCIKSYYANTCVSYYEYTKDCKINGEISKEWINELIRDRLFFSTGTSISQPTVDLLEEMFPEKSKWEK